MLIARGRRRSEASSVHADHFPPAGRFVDSQVFSKLLGLERKRSERTGDSFVLMVLDFGLLGGKFDADRIEEIGSAIAGEVRDTDVVGWYRYPLSLGVIFTTLRNVDRAEIRSRLLEKIRNTLRTHLEDGLLDKVIITCHFYPEEGGKKSTFGGDEKLYADLEIREKSRTSYRILKRALDLTGSVCGLIVFSPVFLIAPILIKLSSPGPVFFSQERIGRFGRTFRLLKFRTMYVDTGHEIHENYIRNLIRNRVECSCNPDGKSKPVFKIVGDPRVTPIGRLLRKTSMDELPQFLNVLRGEMSLVGPRPPIAYEVACYDCWHRRRIMEVKPGITGLWQVYGRSRTTFDEMVRLDLRYVREQSLWLDLKLLFLTPFVAFTGQGAY